MNFYYGKDGSYLTLVKDRFSNYFYSAMSVTIIGFFAMYGLEVLLFLLSWMNLDLLYVFIIYADFIGIASGVLLVIPIGEHLLSYILQE